MTKETAKAFLIELDTYRISDHHILHQIISNKHDLVGGFESNKIPVKETDLGPMFFFIYINVRNKDLFPGT